MPGYSVLGGEAVLADAAEFAREILGEVFPFHAGLFLVIYPTADAAYILHMISLLFRICVND